MESAEQAQKNEAYLLALRDLLYQLADDELTLGHRDSEWLGLSPDIEGDVAFSSVAQDEVGHAVFYFELLHELGEKDPDRLAFARDLSERKNAVLLERENGDWAYSIARHFMYDVWDDLRLEALTESSYVPLAKGAIKIRREEYYHLLHMHSYFVRLGQAGKEAKKRLELAVKAIWKDIGGIFGFGVYEQKLVEFNIITKPAEELKQRWVKRMQQAFAEAQLTWPDSWEPVQYDGRRGEHSPELEQLLQTMSEVYRIDPTARW
ncbi:ring-1,2-phenylacetyl-CoA epoxidase subunit PaaC [Thermoflavimicrobium dichotomicum]|uniref:Ring-1,2-phenylacetyl-CoA epoxidase subunit PaaC n=2 Tax=Thermoflavimicrobium dichotomicum TaxID=46223 RepID=A0A1I3LJQ1_9BACL|nr:ring-1,2-phenylacetyl-CoA epoxidase subunit PaaC [Thermoflavimicrobium dichotomicum]